MLTTILVAFVLQTSALPTGDAGGLNRFENDGGWISLFDGTSFAGWRGIGRDSMPDQGWNVVDGCLHHLPKGGGGDLVTTELYGDFELEFEWKVAPGANSGVKYLVRDEVGQGAAFGPEYQVLDDEKHENGASDRTSAGALYGVIGAAKANKPLVGGFNASRILCQDGRIEHWLNGVQLFVIDRAGDDWSRKIAASKFKGREDFAAAGPGRIALQDHGDEVWYRNLRLRELPGASAPEVELFNGEDLSHWREFGDADYEVEGDSILGKVGGGGQSFLISKQHFGDFIFEVDVKTEEPGNSGIQIRSHQKDGNRPFGYQIEIDPSERAWSGGLYDEARRGWLQNLEQNEAGRAAFRHQEWNRFRIEAMGPWLKVRVNGVPTTDYFDTTDLEGFLGLQVHSGNNTKVRWRRPRLWDFGVRDWEPVSLVPDQPAFEWAWNVGGPGLLELPQSGSDSKRRSPVLKFEFESTTPEGELHVMLTDQEPSIPHLCQSSSGLATPLPDGWCVRVQPNERIRPFDWNEVSIGIEGDRCALQINGRTKEVTRMQSGRNGTKLYLIAVGEDVKMTVRDLKLLGDPGSR